MAAHCRSYRNPRESNRIGSGMEPDPGPKTHPVSETRKSASQTDRQKMMERRG